MNNELEIVEKTDKGNWVKVTKPEHVSLGDYVRYGAIPNCFAYGDSLAQGSVESRKVTIFRERGVVETSDGNDEAGTDDLFAWNNVNKFVPNENTVDSNKCVGKDTEVLTDKGFMPVKSITTALIPTKPVKARIVAYTGGGYGFVMKFPSRVKFQSFTMHEYTRKSDAKRAIKSICNKLNLEFLIK
jgi:hypothetical protein